MARPLLEICVDSVSGAVRAEQAGADRIELCAALVLGGTTPSFGAIALATEVLTIPVMVMIRPRGGDFVYDTDDFEVMVSDIEAAKAAEAAGVVFGVLTQSGEIDVDRMGELLELAAPMPVTFHRAFDVVRDRAHALETLCGLGVTRVLTSGGRASAVEGQGELHDLVARAGKRIVVMPGGGIREDSLGALAAATGAREFHATAFSKRTSAAFRPAGAPDFNKPVVPPEAELTDVDPERVAALIRALGD